MEKFTLPFPVKIWQPRNYLGWNELGFTSRGYQVPMLLIGRYKLGRTGIRALSEIGAHVFAHQSYGSIEECRMC